MQANSARLSGPDTDLQYTDHAMLVAWGHFARQFGLVQALVSVPLAQKTVDHIPQSKLLHYGEDAVGTDPAGWFHRYNERQTVEAGIKEDKGVFQMRHLKLRSPAGLVLAEAFALFVANLVRWAAVWLAEANQAAPAPFVPNVPNGDSIQVKQLVRTGANTSA